MGRGSGPSKMEQIHDIEHGPGMAQFFSRSCHYEDYDYDD